MKNSVRVMFRRGYRKKLTIIGAGIYKSLFIKELFV